MQRPTLMIALSSRLESINIGINTWALSAPLSRNMETGEQETRCIFGDLPLDPFGVVTPSECLVQDIKYLIYDKWKDTDYLKGVAAVGLHLWAITARIDDESELQDADIDAITRKLDPRETWSVLAYPNQHLHIIARRGM
ncbi:hypothetical protein BOTBODRAFT_470385 [Botryobasidium botryosum FD-172 SS1]|uniref:Uncharacterized protein n=1 Tax=Botryobasidium botryosum (strain FD-172 SS1) TaxID=930990 RepID=A0A067M8J4_BOTB1|nr:hypothetical protein BOTBODRAFT_470385 [Botryobasidium botryosum FD-172 SS1]